MGVGYSQISTISLSFYFLFSWKQRKRVSVEAFACSVHMSLFLMQKIFGRYIYKEV
jgi:hypothetical protein